ncbi:hypothetical protein WR25_09367 [Diploscapter pachys]|uniref:ZP domain-containing protein n=1 Tax=Diploscapter pachys TaxID=2018661 RepID=A0A2A2JKQ1_9BILA|nr:hypothetical protein WR25_09367 [Diploscapter pachys]
MGTWTSRLFLVFCYHVLLLFDIGGSQLVNAVGYGGIQSDTNINTDTGTGTGNQPNGLIDSELVQECTANKSVDLLLILDGSGSIGDETFKSQVSFAMSLAQRLNVSDSGSHLAVIQYAEFPRLEFGLDQYTHPTQLEWAIQRINYMSGATNTGKSLKLAIEKGFQGARGGNIPKVAVVITDGQSQDDVAEPSQLLRDSHVMLYAIGVTNLINVHQLHQITGNPVRVFTVESFEELDKSLADSLTWDMCKSEFRPGTPDIICGPDRIGVRASTKEPFDGYVFNCRAGPESFDDARSIGLTIPFSSCNVHRYRSLNPKGIFVEVTFVFMFHQLFMTKSDQTIKLQCFYMEAQKPVTVPLSVSMITTQFREQIYQMPVCTYTLRKDSPDGEIIKFASLGEKVYHRWECEEVEQKDTFGMLVHSCYVDNGFGDRVDVLDENGCGLDFVILRTPEYDSSLRLATIATWVFKYADRPVLQFQCQITLCLKYDNGCKEITPPRNCKKPKHTHENYPHEVELLPATTTLPPKRSKFGTINNPSATLSISSDSNTNRPTTRPSITTTSTQNRNRNGNRNPPSSSSSRPPSVLNPNPPPPNSESIEITRTIGSGNPPRIPPDFIPPEIDNIPSSNANGKVQRVPPAKQSVEENDFEGPAKGINPQQHSIEETLENENRISGYNRKKSRAKRHPAGYGTIDVFTDKIMVLDHKLHCENATFDWQIIALIASTTAANILIFVTSCVVWVRICRKHRYAV